MFVRDELVRLSPAHVAISDVKAGGAHLPLPALLHHLPVSPEQVNPAVIDGVTYRVDGVKKRESGTADRLTSLPNLYPSLFLIFPSHCYSSFKITF